MARLFIYDNRSFPDPDASLSVEDVRRQFVEFFPELANADTRKEKRGDDTVYTFARRIGTKGAPRRRRSGPDVVAVLRAVPNTTLAIFDLAAQLVDADGELDLDAAAARQPELHLAHAEAENYARATCQAVENLRRLNAR